MGKATTRLSGPRGKPNEDDDTKYSLPDYSDYPEAIADPDQQAVPNDALGHLDPGEFLGEQSGYGSPGGGDNGGSAKPIVLDLDGDGVVLVALEDSTAFYDINGDGLILPHEAATGRSGSDSRNRAARRTVSSNSSRMSVMPRRLPMGFVRAPLPARKVGRAGSWRKPIPGNFPGTSGGRKL